jgi:hypothetical protein
MSKLRQRIARLRKVLARATGAPWIVEHIELNEDGMVAIEHHPSWWSNPWHTTVGWKRADRELVQHAVRELPDLLDVLERQDEALREVREHLASFVEGRGARLLEVNGLERCIGLIDAALDPALASGRREAG